MMNWYLPRWLRSPAPSTPSTAAPYTKPRSCPRSAQCRASGWTSGASSGLRRLLDAVFAQSPQGVPEGLGERLGMLPVLKIETINPICCCKGRSGDFLAETAGPGEVLSCASAGNLGRGLAYAGGRCGVLPRTSMSAEAPISHAHEHESML